MGLIVILSLCIRIRGVDFSCKNFLVCHTGSMLKRSRRSIDINRMAASIVKDATEEVGPTPEESGKNPAAVALGRLGGLKGGRARANKLSAKRRKEIAKEAAEARWNKLP